MNGIAKTAAKRLIDFIPTSLCQRLIDRPATGLLYHMVSDEEVDHVRYICDYKTGRMFESDLQYLKENYRCASYEDLAGGALSKKRAGPHAVALSFDDGYAECFSVVRPLLLEYEIPCIFFLTTDFIDNGAMFYRNKVSLCIKELRARDRSELVGFPEALKSRLGRNMDSVDALEHWLKTTSSDSSDIIDEIGLLLDIDEKKYLARNRPYVTTDEIKALASDGFKIGAHTKRHHRFKTLRPEEIQDEIVGSCEKIMEITGDREIPFSFPFNNIDCDIPYLRDLKKRYDFLGLLFSGNVAREDEEVVLSRITADSRPDVAEGGSNLPALLQKTYQSQLIENRHYLVKSLLHP